MNFTLDLAKLNRKTIMIDAELEKKIRLLQAKKIAATRQDASFSQILNEVLRKGLKS